MDDHEQQISQNPTSMAMKRPPRPAKAHQGFNITQSPDSANAAFNLL